MSNYNFSALDDKEFEQLVCDLLSEELGKRVERFKPGKDQGVDGRWFTAEQSEGIIQCKHWMRTGFDPLLRTLASKELPKIVRLSPSRYILATSVELSRSNKKQIVSKLQPYIISENDVFGLEDIEDLLGKHPDVERRHYKLWLSSSAVLMHLFNNAVTGRSEFDTETLKSKVRLLVKTRTFDESAELLNRMRTLIITGSPGIGKTTLAEQLIIEHLVNGFELVTLRGITDGESVFAKDKKQIFYFDDFLGRNMLEALRLQHDSQIVGFIRRVHHDKTKRFVLTSRSSILNQGKHLSDLFSLEKTERNEYEMHIDKISRHDKARILYSHVWHSTLSESKLEELFDQQRYKLIIDHPNFNPRLISFITDSDKSETLDAEAYWVYVTDTLKNPQDIWGHYFSQISQDCRDIAFLVALNGRSIAEGRLRQAFKALRLTPLGNPGKVNQDAMVALKICTGSILNRNIEYRKQSATYDLYNPSIADYVLQAVHDWKSFGVYFAALKTVSSLRNVKEMFATELISDSEFVSIVGDLVDAFSEPELADDYKMELCLIVLEHGKLRERYVPAVRSFLDGLDINDFTSSYDVLLKVISLALKTKAIGDPHKKVEEIMNRVGVWPLGENSLPLVGKLIEFVQVDLESDLTERAKACVVEYWKESIRDHLDEADALRDIYNPGQYTDGERELYSEVERKLSECGLKFSHDEIEAVCEEISMSDIADRNIDWDSQGVDEPHNPSTPTESEVPDSVIDDMFERDVPVQ